MGNSQALGSLQILGPASLDSPTSSAMPVLFLFITPKPVGQQHPHWLTPQVYVLKRPHVDEFLQRMGELFECVLFTASLAKVSPSLEPGAWGNHALSPTFNLQPWAFTHSGVTSLLPPVCRPCR